MPSLDPNQNFSYASAEQGHFVKLDVSDIPTLSAYPQGVYAILTLPVTQIDESGNINSNNDVES